MSGNVSRRTVRSFLLALVASLLAAMPGEGAVELLSPADPAALADTGGADSTLTEIRAPRLSADGRFVVFESFAPNLVSGAQDDNGVRDVFLRDRWTGTTQLVSAAAGTPLRAGNFDSLAGSLSADGRFVLFVSAANDLVPGPATAPFALHAFLHDRLSGLNVRVGPVDRGQSSSDDIFPELSAAGRFVAFRSRATELVPGQVDTFGTPDLFLYDREEGTTVLVSHSPDDPSVAAGTVSGSASLTPDGRFVAYASFGSVLVFDRLSGASTPIGPGRDPVISADGNVLAFTDVVPPPIIGFPDPLGGQNVFVYDRAAGTRRLVSHRSGLLSVAGNGRSSLPALSADGRRVAFMSRATNLVAGQTDANGGDDVFVQDLVTGATVLASRAASSAIRTGNGLSRRPVLSADGGAVAFESHATDLVAFQGERNDGEDVFLFDVAQGSTVLASGAFLSTAATAAGRSHWPEISADGRLVLFTSLGSELILPAAGVDSNGAEDVFVFDRADGSRSAVSLRAPDLPSRTAGGGSAASGLSADGRYAAFFSDAPNVAPEQAERRLGYDIFLRDRVRGTTTLVSHAAGAPHLAAFGESFQAALSGNGRWLAFTSKAVDLIPGLSPPRGSNVFLYDRVTGETILVSRSLAGAATAGNDSSFDPVISASGRYVVFESYASDLVAGQDAENTLDVFLFDRATGRMALVSHASGRPAQPANNGSFDPVISANGRAVVFTSYAIDLVAGVTDGNQIFDLFYYDVATESVSLISRSAAMAGATANNSSEGAELSADGRTVAFFSWATDLVPGQIAASEGPDAFLFDAGSGSIVLVSHAAASPRQEGDFSSFPISLSADGRYLTFVSEARDLLPGPPEEDQDNDCFLYDRETGGVRLVSASAASGQPGNFESINPQISADGRVIAFDSYATDLVAGQTARSLLDSNVYLYEVATRTVTLVSRAESSLQGGNGFSVVAGISADGQAVLFTSGASDLIPFDFNLAADVFLFDRALAQE